MKHYYLKNGSRESGPYLLDDLKYQRISSTSLIKVDDGKWEPISQNKDLRFLLESSSGKNGSGSSVFDNRNRSETNANDAAPAKSKAIVAIAVAVFLAALGMAISFFMAAGR